MINELISSFLRLFNVKKVGLETSTYVTPLRRDKHAKISRSKSATTKNVKNMTAKYAAKSMNLKRLRKLFISCVIHSAKVRIRQLEEAVQIIRKMWTEEKAIFKGKYYQIKDAVCSPRPNPLPPIMIGGGGEKLTLRVVAKHADWWNLPNVPVETYKT